MEADTAGKISNLVDKQPREVKLAVSSDSVTDANDSH